MSKRSKRLSDLSPLDLMPDMVKFAEEMNAIIAKAYDERGTQTSEVAPEAWDQLESILIEYLQNLIDWDGYLKKGQIDDLARLAKDAKKLRSDWERIQKSGASWFVGSLLEIKSFSNQDFIRFLELAHVLAEMDPRSPIAEPASLYPSRKLVTADWTSPGSRPELQLKLDEWWVLNTGLPKDVDEDETTTYKSFLKELFAPLAAAGSHGSSSTAVQNARKSGRQQEAYFPNLMAKFHKRLRRHRATKT